MGHDIGTHFEEGEVRAEVLGERGDFVEKQGRKEKDVALEAGVELLSAVAGAKARHVAAEVAPAQTCGTASAIIFTCIGAQIGGLIGGIIGFG